MVIGPHWPLPDANHDNQSCHHALRPGLDISPSFVGTPRFRPRPSEQPIPNRNRLWSISHAGSPPLPDLLGIVVSCRSACGRGAEGRLLLQWLHRSRLRGYRKSRLVTIVPRGRIPSSRIMSQSTVDPVEYLTRFCAEIGVSATNHNLETVEEPANQRVERKARRRLFLRMYQYSGQPFVIRSYERILGRYPSHSEVIAAQCDFFEGRVSRTSLMLALRFGEEGQRLQSCNVVGLSALRLLWNATHRRGRRVAPLRSGT